MNRLMFLGAVLLTTGTCYADPAGAFTYDSRTNQTGGASFAKRDASQANPDGSISLGDSRLSMKFSGSGMSQPATNSANARFLSSSNDAFNAPYNEGLSSMDMALGNRH